MNSLIKSNDLLWWTEGRKDERTFGLLESLDLSDRKTKKKTIGECYFSTHLTRIGLIYCVSPFISFQNHTLNIIKEERMFSERFGTSNIIHKFIPTSAISMSRAAKIFRVWITTCRSPIIQRELGSASSVVSESPGLRNCRRSLDGIVVEVERGSLVEVMKKGFAEKYISFISEALRKKLDILWQSVKGWVGSKLKTWFLS